MGRYILEEMEPMIALWVAVDYPRALEEALVLELLCECRLARPQRPDAEDRGVRVLVGALTKVEEHRPARPREGVPEVVAATRTGEMGGRGHHRRKLFRRERVVVAGHACSLTGEMLNEQLELFTERPVEPHLPICPAGELDSRLELALRRCTDGDADRRAQEGRPARCLQVSEQISRLPGALITEVACALLPSGLRAQDLVGILDLATSQSQGEFVGKKPRGHADVHRERQRFRRREHQLGAVPREPGDFRYGTERQERLAADAELRLDAQRPRALLDLRVEPAQHIALERRE